MSDTDGHVATDLAPEVFATGTAANTTGESAGLERSRNTKTSKTESAAHHTTDAGQPSYPLISFPFVPTFHSLDQSRSSSFAAILHAHDSHQYNAERFMETCSSPAYYGPQVFVCVMDNLLRNPNITSSHLFRADVLWDSERDVSFEPMAWTFNSPGELKKPQTPPISKFVAAMRVELRPRFVAAEGFELRRCVVRDLVPRNTNLDRRLAQTCAFFRQRRRISQRLEGQAEVRDGVNDCDCAVSRKERNDAEPRRGSGLEDGEEELNLVVYIPHVDREDELPWYHPRVKALAFLHTWRTLSDTRMVPEFTDTDINNDKNSTRSITEASPADMEFAPGRLSLHTLPFMNSQPSSFPSATVPTQPTSRPQTTNRLHRTLLNLLSTLHAHGHGSLTGYTKRVHHDRLLPQSDLQDIYTRLKNKYALPLLNTYWQESTDARKGVFEDLGIASFLIGLWGQMYDVSACVPLDEQHKNETPANPVRQTFSTNRTRLPCFPGWVDIGCGNGILAFILLSEGYPGLAFDARSRKTWAAFPAAIRANLHEMVLVPSVLGAEVPKHVSRPPTSASLEKEGADEKPQRPPREMPRVHNGVFARGTFIISNHADELTPWTPLLAHAAACPFVAIPCCSHSLSGAKWRAPVPGTQRKARHGSKDDTHAEVDGRAGESAGDHAGKGGKTGSLARPAGAQGRATSAYASLCAYVEMLAGEVGFVVETEALRIPSTRNYAIVGRFVRRGGVEGVGGGNEGSETWGRSGSDGLPKGEEQDGAKGDEEAELRKEPIAQAYEEGEDARICRESKIQGIIERELGRSVQDVGREWVERIEHLVASKGRNH